MLRDGPRATTGASSRFAFAEAVFLGKILRRVEAEMDPLLWPSWLSPVERVTSLLFSFPSQRPALYVNVTAATGILLWCHFRVASHVFLAITVRALHGQTECPLWSSLMGESRIMYLFRQVFVRVQKPG